MPRTEVEIVNKLGLHARAAAKLTQLAGNFTAELCRVLIEADGEDAESALAAVVRLITERFGEEE